MALPWKCHRPTRHRIWLDHPEVFHRPRWEVDHLPVQNRIVVDWRILMENQSWDQLVAVARSAGYYRLTMQLDDDDGERGVEKFHRQGHQHMWTEISHNRTRRRTWCCYSFCHFILHVADGFPCKCCCDITVVSVVWWLIPDDNVVSICWKLCFAIENLVFATTPLCLSICVFSLSPVFIVEMYRRYLQYS